MATVARALALATALALSIALPTSAFVHAVYAWDGAGGSGAVCGGATANESDLSSWGGCGWSDRITSVRGNLLLGTQCIVFYKNAGYSGAAWAYHSTAVTDVPSGFNNAISSYQFASWEFVAAIGQYACVA